jgi:hypothetical protein
LVSAFSLLISNAAHHPRVADRQETVVYVEVTDAAAVMQHQPEIRVDLAGRDFHEQRLVALHVENEQAVDLLRVLQDLVVRLEGTLCIGRLGLGRPLLLRLGRVRHVHLGAAAQGEHQDHHAEARDTGS